MIHGCRWEEVVAAARHHARDEAGSGKGGRGGKAGSASSASTKQTAAAKFLLNMIKCVVRASMHPFFHAAWTGPAD